VSFVLFGTVRALADGTAAASPSSSGHTCSTDDDIKKWFARYDVVRRESKSTLKEKFQARRLLGIFLNPLGFEIEDSRDIIGKVIARYGKAADDLEKIPQLPETEELQTGFIQFFREAKQLFLDMLEVENLPYDKRQMAWRALGDRKRKLDELDRKNKTLDGWLRSKFYIPQLRL
jgi:hypothetical protein